jgi:hypothetical protein
MDWAPGPDEVSLTFGATGLTVVAPLPGAHYRVVATVDEAPATPDLAFVQRLLDERAPGLPRSPGWPGPHGSGCTTGSPTTTGSAVCCSPATRRTSTAQRAFRG